MVGRTRLYQILFVGLAVFTHCGGVSTQPQPARAGDTAQLCRFKWGESRIAEPGDYQLWLRLLRAAQDHTEADRRLIEDVLREPPTAATSALARVLLAEWSAEPNADSFVRPVKVYSPEADLGLPGETEPPKKPWAFVKGMVCEDGLIENVELWQPSGTTAWDDRCLALLRGSRFRPARKSGKYIAHEYVMGCEAHYR